MTPWIVHPNHQAPAMVTDALRNEQLTETPSQDGISRSAIQEIMHRLLPPKIAGKRHLARISLRNSSPNPTEPPVSGLNKLQSSAENMEDKILSIAAAYHKLLTCIDWSDPIFVSGIREGKNKFLSNAWLSHTRSNKYHKTNWISVDALSKIKSNDYSLLVFEHLVPKQKYIQDPCEQLAMKNQLTLPFVVELLSRYWHMATITKQEDDRLLRRSAPVNWDSQDIHARYKLADIELIPNPYFAFTDIIAEQDETQQPPLAVPSSTSPVL